MILSDETYGRLIYAGNQHFSITRVPGFRERAILLDGRRGCTKRARRAKPSRVIRGL